MIKSTMPFIIINYYFMNANKNLEYIASAKFIVNSGLDCFNNCVNDFERQELIPLEKHCMEGCMSIKYGVYSSSATTRPPKH